MGREDGKRCGSGGLKGVAGGRSLREVGGKSRERGGEDRTGDGWVYEPGEDEPSR